MNVAFNLPHTLHTGTGVVAFPFQGKEHESTLVKYENKMWLIKIFSENKPNWNWAVLYEIKPNRRKYIFSSIEQIRNKWYESDWDILFYTQNQQFLQRITSVS